MRESHANCVRVERSVLYGSDMLVLTRLDMQLAVNYDRSCRTEYVHLNSRGMCDLNILPT